MTSTKLVVGAIDFGTTYSGYAFSFAHDYEKDPMKIQANHWIGGGHMSLKAPTTILFTPEKVFHSFGYQAEDKYADLAEEDIHKDWYYFRRFKMILHQQTTLSRKTLLYDENKKAMTALHVFSSAIKFLKDDLCDEISKKMTGFEERDIFWVLTVPAIWTDAAKKFMREAAVEADIKSECLSLALEPEAASVFCKLLPVNCLKLNSSKFVETFKPGTSYIVLDLGGGTVDVTVHHLEYDGKLSEIARASGGAWGATQVDEAYLEFLEELFGRCVFQAFRENNTSDFLEMLREFEIKKRLINTKKEGKIVIRFAASLSETYKEKCGKTLAYHILPGHLGSFVQLKKNKILVDANVMRKFFSESIKNTSIHVRKILEENELRKIDTLLLVGGFAESEIVQGSVKEAFPNKRIIVPSEPGLAVLKGAVLFGHNPLVMKSRISKYTYGTEIIRPFVDGTDQEKYKVFENGIYKCRYKFFPFVQAGEMVPVGTVVRRYCISDTFDVEEGVGIYASTKEHPKYVVDDCCFRVGTVYFDEPRQHFMAEMHFGETEICLKCIFESGIKKTVEFDYLCT
ncbi:heat shock 70 kDa protein 12B-like [Ruditapes philippinarum]|uniref:heat shock 70 kDa protein 12B-like n=1 Tax=Ruditapes philippinarum TaxID=129788 RepID=UPI00295B9200|nr:heat shock 70 kDa protein 12B-like [Ruditapes philippinarum]XP_060557857.1 heat shock 70 kDa protein 12B-like [Ruditapes philippinarum]